MFGSTLSTNGISFIIVFLEGILSFFSPCIIPLIPVYMSYLAGNTDNTAGGQLLYNRKKVFYHTVFYHTVFFVIGISFAFFILGLSFTALGSFFLSKKLLFTRIAGILITILGLHQLGFFELKFLNIERKLHMDISKRNVNPMFALLMGFTFSFAWTPCVGTCTFISTDFVLHCQQHFNRQHAGAIIFYRFYYSIFVPWAIYC